MELINVILYKFKTGVQWYQLPTKALFCDKVLSCEPMAGNHNDRYNIEEQFEFVTNTLKDAELSVGGYSSMPMLVF
ncbi:hypothetical protein RYH73_25760 [Olivibacter sp. CPCC 100613]|uniref:hypothetical protein n=1 Tax=Olivibacter sp. CPCC 100613 TaxID=3079931 RepID=UPI002FF5A84D